MGSEMCIRDRNERVDSEQPREPEQLADKTKKSPKKSSLTKTRTKGSRRAPQHLSLLLRRNHHLPLQVLPLKGRASQGSLPLPPPGGKRKNPKRPPPKEVRTERRNLLQSHIIVTEKNLLPPQGVGLPKELTTNQDLHGSPPDPQTIVEGIRERRTLPKRKSPPLRDESPPELQTRMDTAPRLPRRRSRFLGLVVRVCGRGGSRSGLRSRGAGPLP